MHFSERNNKAKITPNSMNWKCLQQFIYTMVFNKLKKKRDQREPQLGQECVSVEINYTTLLNPSKGFIREPYTFALNIAIRLRR